MEQLEAFIASAASDLTSQPLSTLFLHSRTINQNQDALVTRARQQPALLDKSLAVCRQLVASVESAALFSANEELDDIATGDIKFLLAPFYLAELLGSCPAPDGPTQRLRQVQEAHSAYNSFLHRCQHYGLLGELGSKLYKTMEEQGGQLDPSTKRSAKIELFKADKALASQIAMLESQRSKSEAGDEQDGQQAGTLGGARGWGEDDERAMWLTAVTRAALKALGQRQMLAEEKGMLEAIAARGGPPGGSGPGRPGGARAEMEDMARQQVLQQLRKVAADLGSSSAAAAVGVDRRAELRAGVFRPGHNLPTRSLAEQADIEVAEARAREERERAAHDAEAARKAALGSDEDEEELTRTRARDDFRDANPYGWGNSKLRPCG